MNKYIDKIIVLCIVLCVVFHANAENPTAEQPKSGEKEFVVRDFILEHIGDVYMWHITRVGERDIYVSLPVIVKSKQSGWHVFASSKLAEGHHYNGFYISEDGDYKGKIVELDSHQKEVRPLDLSITRNVFTLLFSATLLITLILYVARSYKKSVYGVKNKFVCFIEMMVMMMNDDVIKPCVGKDYKKYSPYLLTLFFFILINNFMGIIPIFPFGANLSGNIVFTLTLAVITFIIVNLSGTREYWKEIFWPDVPLAMKFPVPFFPLLEVIGVFTKPFALTIRLLANMTAGHSIILGLISIIFVTVKMGTTANISLTFVSVFLGIFISFIELLVAFIQAYVFTLLSAVYIGLAKIEPHHKSN
jgi:F-type H+-transporting ATPase subunit a